VLILWQAFVFGFLAVCLSWVLDRCCLACCPRLLAFFVVAVCIVFWRQLVALFGPHCGCIVIVMFSIHSHEGAAQGVRIHHCGCFSWLSLSAHSVSSLMLFVACVAVNGFSSCSSVQEGSPQPPHSRNCLHIVSGIPRLVRVAVMFVLFA